MLHGRWKRIGREKVHFSTLEASKCWAASSIGIVENTLASNYFQHVEFHESILRDFSNSDRGGEAFRLSKRRLDLQPPDDVGGGGDANAHKI